MRSEPLKRGLPANGDCRVDLELYAVQVLPQRKSDIDGDTLILKRSFWYIKVDAKDAVDPFTPIVFAKGCWNCACWAAHYQCVDVILVASQFAGIGVVEARIQADPIT